MECRIGKASGVFARLKECVWKRRNISLKTKMIYNTVVITTLLYASECWMLLATNLTKLEVFQMSCLQVFTWGNPTRPATEWHDTAPLLGSAHCWEADPVESSLIVSKYVPNKWFPLAKTASMNIRMVGVVLLMHQWNNEGSGRCRRDDSSTQMPLLWLFDGGRRRHMVVVKVRHHRHQPTSWPIKQVRTSRSLKRHWTSADPNLC